MNDNDRIYKEIQKKISRLTDTEKIRKEKHAGTRIIYNSEITPVQIYRNVMDNTTFIYKNIAPEEGTKVKKKMLREGKEWRIILGTIILILDFLFVIFSIILFKNNALEFVYVNTKKSIGPMVAVIFLSSLMIMFIGIALIATRKKNFMAAEYPGVYSPFRNMSRPVEFNRLTNGQLVFVKYWRSDKSCGQYSSALNPDGTIWYSSAFDFSKILYISTYVEYIYIIDEVKSCTRTENGLMVESSGRYYGIRYGVFAETQVSYRKEEIPAIFTNMDQLESSLMSYGHYEQSGDAFSPLQAE